MLHEVTGPTAVLVEDAAQSQGATRHGSASGSFGAVAATSYYPGKNLGAYGDGGAVTTDRDDVAERVMALRNHGGVVKYDHGLLGMNSRLDSLQAAVLSVKLGHLPAWNAERRVAADRYATLLSDLDAVRCRASCRATSMSGTCTWSGCRHGTGSWTSFTSRGSARESTTRPRCTCFRRSPISAAESAPSR